MPLNIDFTQLQVSLEGDYLKKIDCRYTKVESNIIACNLVIDNEVNIDLWKSAKKLRIRPEGDIHIDVKDYPRLKELCLNLDKINRISLAGRIASRVEIFNNYSSGNIYCDFQFKSDSVDFSIKKNIIPLNDECKELLDKYKVRYQKIEDSLLKGL